MCLQDHDYNAATKDPSLKSASLAGRNLAHQIIPKRFGAVFIDQRERIDDVPCALTHLCSAEIPPAVHQ